ncbi:MAG: DUF1249 domain-containing protein [Thiolinea sp.]
MLTKEQAKYVVAPRPQSFAGLMEMYEVNYIYLRLLLGDLRQFEQNMVGKSPEHLPLAVTVKDRSRHTLTLLLTYHFTNEQGEVIETRPDLLVRVCHDSLQAEVITHKCRFSDQRVRYWWRKPDSMLLCRWRMNRFLFKWLSYLRRQKYSFCID